MNVSVSGFLWLISMLWALALTMPAPLTGPTHALNPCSFHSYGWVGFPYLYTHKYNPRSVTFFHSTFGVVDADPDGDPTFNFDADPDPDPTLSFTHVGKSKDKFGLFTGVPL